MTLSGILLALCLINAVKALAIQPSGCENPRTIIQNGTYSDELPVIEATVEWELNVPTAEECLANAGQYDIVETWKGCSICLFNCVKYTLAYRKGNRAVYHNAITCGGSPPNWWVKPNFSLATYDGLPRRSPGFFNEQNAVSFSGKGDTFSVPELKDSCAVNLDNCIEGVVYSFWIKNTIDLQRHFTSRRFFFTSGGHLNYSQGVAFYTVDGIQQWNFKSKTHWWKADTKVYSVPNRWTHLIATWSTENGINIYQNGVEVYNDYALRINGINYPEQSLPPNGRNNDFVFGRANEAYDNGYTNGKFILDDFKIVFYREINADDAKRLFLSSFSN